ncbi:hypothetical protein NDU88_007450 [Pleurodeles waltl]|uniref:Uncharacterized protein n=1 Tax=Pleurodeles waltl TaxID=8319 RepID=A0AAV7QPW3_PLEWA|nr:hypothetical protein NDU88_007450 [Pleurodeles waltl]
MFQTRVTVGRDVAPCNRGQEKLWAQLPAHMAHIQVAARLVLQSVWPRMSASKCKVAQDQEGQPSVPGVEAGWPKAARWQWHLKLTHGPCCCRASEVTFGRPLPHDVIGLTPKLRSPTALLHANTPINAKVLPLVRKDGRQDEFQLA